MTEKPNLTRRSFFRAAGKASLAASTEWAVAGELTRPSHQPSLEKKSRVLLFFDEHMILTMKNTCFSASRALKVPENPVIRGDRPWEGKTVAEATVFYDEEQKLFRMWYPVYDYHPPMPPANLPLSQNSQAITDIATERKRCTACYAVSEDGYHWEKPVLGLVEFRGSKANNILVKSSGGRDHFATGHVFRDPVEEDPAKRYKSVKSRMIPGSRGQAPRMGLDLYYSPDGFTWTPYKGNPVFDLKRPGSWGPTSFMGWDPLREVYAVYMENCGHQRCPIGKRLIGRAESPDMIHWSEPDTILVPDDTDGPNTEPYALHPCVYEGFYLGLLWVYSLTRQDHHPQFVFSRDGTRFDRRYRQAFITKGTSPEFDSLAILPLKPVVQGDTIFIYYIGTNYRTREQFDKLGAAEAEWSIGLAVLPRDRFVGLESTGQEGGEVVTRSIRVSGNRLWVNAQGIMTGPSEVKVEILDPAYFPVAGHTVQEASPVSLIGLENPATWGGNPDIGALAGKLVKLRLYLKNARVFALRFEE